MEDRYVPIHILLHGDVTAEIEVGAGRCNLIEGELLARVALPVSELDRLVTIGDDKLLNTFVPFVDVGECRQIQP